MRQTILKRVRICGTGSYLPNDPVPNSMITQVLGEFDRVPRKIDSFVEGFEARVAEEMGVDSRHFAIDKATGKMTHDACSLSVPAAQAALRAADRSPRDVDLLLLSTSLFDQCSPPTTTFLQDALDLGHCAEMEIHSNCSGVGKCVQVAFDALRLGRYRTALIVYPQLSSAYLRKDYYNQARVTKTQAALRYILADGAGAIIIEAVDDDAQAIDHEILGTYVESIGCGRPAAMTAGGGNSDQCQYENLEGIFAAGSHHLDQDLALVGREAPHELFEGARRATQALGLQPSDVDRLVVSVPSQKMYRMGIDLFRSHFTSCPENPDFPFRNMGYTGGAAVLIHLDKLARNSELRTGELVLVYSLESSKWMSGGFAVRW